MTNKYLYENTYQEHIQLRDEQCSIINLEQASRELQYFKQRLSDLLDEKLEETMDNDEYMRRSILDFINELKKELGL